MFQISQNLKNKAEDVSLVMERDNLEIHDLNQDTFKGYLVKDQTSELQKKIDSKSYILGQFVSKSGIKYWISLN